MPIGERAIAGSEVPRGGAARARGAGRTPGTLFLNELGESIGLDWLTVMVRRYVDEGAGRERPARVTSSGTPWRR